MTTYEIISCDKFGTSRVNHPGAKQLQAPTEILNDVGTFQFSVPLDDPNPLSTLKPSSGREVQVWRGGTGNGILVWWGAVTDRRILDRNHWEITCNTLDWYFTKRVIGKPGRNNYLVNGDFGTGTLAGWTPVGVTANIVTQWGTHAGSYQLNEYQAGAGTDTFVYQTVTLQPGYYTLAAWFQIRADSTYVGPAVDGRGLYVERLASDNATVDTVQFFAITNDTPRGLFQRATTNIQIDRANTVVRIRLYSTLCTNATPSGGRPPGSIIWAKVQLVLQDSQSFPYPSDLSNVFNNLTQHAQDPAYGKDDLAILGNNPGSGILVDRTYLHSDHQVIHDCFKEWSDAGLCDFGVSWDQNTKIRRMAIFPGKRGSMVTSQKLEIGGNMLSLPTVEEDGTKTITSAIVTGQGTGADTDEGGAIDTSATNGLVLEAVYTQRQGGYYDQLNLQAAETVHLSRDSYPVPQAVLSSSMIGVVGLGDILAMYDPVANLQENVRITQTEIDLETDHFTVVVNPY